MTLLIQAWGRLVRGAAREVSPPYLTIVEGAARPGVQSPSVQSLVPLTVLQDRLGESA